jgi:hypothetical protein
LAAKVWHDSRVQLIRALAFLDPLLRRAALISKATTLGRPGQVGDDEPDASSERQQYALV